MFFEIEKMIEDDSVVDYLVAKGNLGNFSKRYEIERMILEIDKDPPTIICN